MLRWEFWKKGAGTSSRPHVAPGQPAQEPGASAGDWAFLRSRPDFDPAEMASVRPLGEAQPGRPGETSPAEPGGWAAAVRPPGPDPVEPADPTSLTAEDILLGVALHEVMEPGTGPGTEPCPEVGRVASAAQLESGEAEDVLAFALLCGRSAGLLADAVPPRRVPRVPGRKGRNRRGRRNR